MRDQLRANAGEIEFFRRVQSGENRVALFRETYPTLSKAPRTGKPLSDVKVKIKADQIYRRVEHFIRHCFNDACDEKETAKAIVEGKIVNPFDVLARLFESIDAGMGLNRAALIAKLIGKPVHALTSLPDGVGSFVDSVSVDDKGKIKKVNIASKSVFVKIAADYTAGYAGRVLEKQQRFQGAIPAIPMTQFGAPPINPPAGEKMPADKPQPAAAEKETP